MTTHLPGRARPLAAGLAVIGLLLAGCQTQPGAQPRTAVTCTPGTISIAVTNVSSKPAKYTVTVDIERAGYTDSEQYSSNRVEPGATGTITDKLPDEKAKCTVTGVDVFDA